MRVNLTVMPDSVCDANDDKELFRLKITVGGSVHRSWGMNFYPDQKVGYLLVLESELESCKTDEQAIKRLCRILGRRFMALSRENL